METVRQDAKQECINGVLFNMSPSPHYRHSEIIENILRLLNTYMDRSICRAYGNHIDVYFNEQSKDFVIPDVSIICDKSKFKSGRYYGTPKFIVEVLSPATRKRDLGEKKELYEKCGVEEYWTIDYASLAIDIYYLSEGRYHLAEAYQLVEDPKDEAYNGEAVIVLKDFPHIKMSLKELFE